MVGGGEGDGQLLGEWTWCQCAMVGGGEGDGVTAILWSGAIPGVPLQCGVVGCQCDGAMVGCQCDDQLWGSGRCAIAGAVAGAIVVCYGGG